MENPPIQSNFLCQQKMQSLDQSTGTSCVSGSSYEETVKAIWIILRPLWYTDAEYNKISKLVKGDVCVCVCVSVGGRKERKGTGRHVRREGGEVLEGWGPDWQDSQTLEDKDQLRTKK